MQYTFEDVAEDEQYTFEDIQDDALRGELGAISNSDGSTSTEYSITENIPELGGWVNIPTMVQGQSDLSFLESGELTRENRLIAIRRAIERKEAGATLPSYKSLEEAEHVAESRTEAEKSRGYEYTFEDVEPEASTLSDVGTEIAAGAVAGAGYATRGVGSMFEKGGAQLAKGLNWTFNTDFFRSENILENAGEAVEQYGKELGESTSAEWQEAKGSSQISGDISDPSTWSWGTDPSLKGYAANVLNVFGQAGPMAALAVVTRGAGLPTGVAGAATTIGAGESEIQSEIEKLNYDGLQRESGLYRDRMAQGDSKEQARQHVIDTIQDEAFWKLAAIGGIGGIATGYVLGGTAKKLGAGAAGRVAAEGVGEGTEELLEGIAKNDAFGAAEIKKELLEGSLGNFAMGVMGGAATGGVVAAGEGAVDLAGAPLTKGAKVGREFERALESAPDQSGDGLTAFLQPTAAERDVAAPTGVDIQGFTIADLPERSPIDTRRADAADQGADALGQELAAGDGMADALAEDAGAAQVSAERDAVVATAKADFIAGMQQPTEPPAPPSQPPKQVQGLEIVEAPVADITLSDDIPQFKEGADESGVVEPLGGKFDRIGVGPIQIWVREDGRQEVISGRHRLDLARRSGEETIPAQYHYESDGFSARQAAGLDARLNIREGQGKVKDYVGHIQAEGFTEKEADAEGILARATGKRAYSIATKGSDALVAAHSADQLSDIAATKIAEAAPNDESLQAVGIKAIQEGKSNTVAENLVKAVGSIVGDKPQESGDLFGFDDSAMVEAENLAKAAAAKQAEIQRTLSAVQGAAKRPELAKKEGVDVKDPEAVKARIKELKAEKESWNNWHTNPELVAELKGEPSPSSFDLEPETEVSRREKEAKQTPEAVAAAETKSQVDAEADLFGLDSPPVTLEGAADPIQQEQGGSLFDAPEPAPKKPVKVEPAKPALEVQKEKTEAAKVPEPTPITPLPESVSVGPGLFKPKPIGGTLHRETSAKGASDILSGAFANNAEQGYVGGLFVTDNKDLAIGQGTNQGVSIEFDGDLVSGPENKKPGTGVDGREFNADFVGRDAITSVTITKGKLTKRAGRVLAENFTEVKNADGSTTFTRHPKIKPKPAATPKPTSFAQDSRWASVRDGAMLLTKGQVDTTGRTVAKVVTKRAAALADSVTESVLDSVATLDEALTAAHKSDPEAFAEFEVAVTQAGGTGLNLASTKPTPALEQKKEEKAKKKYGSSNSLFAASDAKIARETMAKGSSTLNSGLNPEMLKAGIVLAGFHIEAGARSFADFSKAMIEDVGAAVEPHLRQLYEAAQKQLPQEKIADPLSAPQDAHADELAAQKAKYERELNLKDAKHQRRAKVLREAKAKRREKKKVAKMAKKKAATEKRAEITAAEAVTNTAPTPEQIEAGNYQKGHVTVHGLDITIENPKGSLRTGQSADGRRWSTRMKDTYGYLKRTLGNDGDHVDVFIGPDLESDTVFVVDQINPKSGKFDEHKVILGAKTKKQARQIYKRNFARNWVGGKQITKMKLDEFNTWLKEGDQNKPARPMDETPPPQAATPPSPPSPPRPPASNPAWRGQGDYDYRGITLTSSNRPPAPWESPEEGIVDYHRRKWQDKMHPLRQVQRAIAKAAGINEMAESVDTLLAEETFIGKLAEDIRKLREGPMQQMVDRLTEHGLERGELDLFLVARHAKERNDYIAKINPKFPDGGSGMTYAQAEAILSKIEADGLTAQFESAAEPVYKMLQLQRRRQVEADLTPPDMENAWNSRYKYYVPLKGVSPTEDATPATIGEKIKAKLKPSQKPETSSGTGRGFDIRGKETIRAMGRRSMAESPSTHAVNDTIKSLERARKNEVGQTFLKMVEQNPNRDYWRIYTTKTPKRDRGIKMVSGVEVVTDTAKIQQMGSEDFFAVKKDGVDYRIEILAEDKRLIRAMNNLSSETLPVFLQYMGAGTRFLSSMYTTYAPEFMLVNPLRDAQTAAFNIMAEADLKDSRTEGHKLAKKMLKGTPRAVRAIHASLYGKELTGKNAEWQGYFERFRAAGAQTGWIDQKSMEGRTADLEKMFKQAQSGAGGSTRRAGLAIKDFVHHANTAAENGARLSAFRAAVDMGVSDAKAASLAKNLTVNFNRKGEYGAVLNSLFMFSNASIQGTATLLRAMTTLKEVDTALPGIGTKRLNAGQKLAIGVAIGGYGWGLAMREAAGEDEDEVNYYEKVPGHVRERNLVIMHSLWGGEPGEYTKIPLPYGYNVFHVFGDQMASAPDKGMSAAATAIASSMLGSFSPIGINISDEPAKSLTRTITPTVFSPFMQLAINENFWGQPITKDNVTYGTQYPDSALGKPGTAEHWKAVAQWMNSATGGDTYITGGVDINPDSMKFLADYIAGGAGRFGVGLFDTGAKWANGQSVDASQVPLARKFTGSVKHYADVDKFYKRVNKIGQHENQRDATPRRSATRRRFESKHEDLLDMVEPAERTAKKLSRLRKDRRELQLSDRTPRQIDRMTKEMDAEIKSVVAQFNLEYNDKVGARQ